MSKQLAIVIPAYKAAFLSAALDSIAAQTCKDFTLYIGDDCSPYNLKEVVEQYRNRIDMVYRRFDNNLGGHDLVAQWHRCIDLTQDEPYIWLFSDDDVMEPNCVEQLYKQIEKTEGTYDLYHFDGIRIDSNGVIDIKRKEYPQVFNAYDFYKGKCLEGYDSFVVENVFSRRVYEQTGGFKNFDLAWGSDITTWCIFCGKKGMCKVPGAHVLWRRSGQNITPDKTRQIVERKLKAESEFLAWAYTYFKEEPDILQTNKRIFINKMLQYKKRVGWHCYQTAFSTFFQTHGHNINKPLTWLLLNIVPIKLYRLMRKRK